MNGSPLARAWDEAADGYESYFVPRFAPWVKAAVSALIAQPLPDGPIVVPCCGTFPELPELRKVDPQREIVGIDLSAGMVARARQRAAGMGRVSVIEGDATALAPESCAAVVCVFGLQQLPDPEAAIASWTAAVRKGGLLSVVFWPGQSEVEGPFALLYNVLADRRPPADISWEQRLAAAVGAVIEKDERVAFPMEHESAAEFWDAMAHGGPLRALANARGEAFMRVVREQFLNAAPGGPWRHTPAARWLVARR